MFPLTRLGAFQNFCNSVSHKNFLSFSRSLYPLKRCCAVGPHMRRGDVNPLLSANQLCEASTKNCGFLVIVCCLRGATQAFPRTKALLICRVTLLLYTKKATAARAL